MDVDVQQPTDSADYVSGHHFLTLIPFSKVIRQKKKEQFCFLLGNTCRYCSTHPLLSAIYGFLQTCTVHSIPTEVNTEQYYLN